LNRGGDIIVYAAEAGRTASDGAGRNSPFSSALLRYVETEGQEIVALMRRVTTSVQQETNGDQRPELSLAVPFEFYFKPGPPQPPPTVQQLLPGAKPHEIGAVETQVELIVGAASEHDRAQVRREVMVLVSDIASRSGLKPDQVAAELPQAFARLAQTRKEIEEFRRLMENEPGIAPFIEIAAAAVSSGRRPDLQAADQALAQAQARYDEAIRARTDALDRARGNRAGLSEQRRHIAETEYRSKEAASFYLAAATDTSAGDPAAAARRYAMAGNALFVHGTNFFANDSLREAIRLIGEEALRRIEQDKPTTDDQKRMNVALRSLMLAGLADAQTKLGGRLPGIEGARMMVEARATYGNALRSLQIDEFPGIAMDILDRRAQRDIEFGRRIMTDRGRRHFEQATEARRVIVAILAKEPRDHAKLGRARNNLAHALKELSRRTDGEAGDRQIDEAIDLLGQSVDAVAQSPDPTEALVARANLAHALTLRAARKPGLDGAADIARARELHRVVDAGLDKQKNPRLWSIAKQYEAELHRLVGERQGEQRQSFQALQSAFELYQSVLTVISRDTAPNDWAIVCAEMGHTITAALPLLSGNDRQRFAGNAIGLFANARPYFAAGGFGQDLERLDRAMTAVRAEAAPAPGNSR
jgi:Caspase domain